MRIINLDINPSNGGSPPNDRINRMVIILFVLFFWVSINRWFPKDILNILISGIEIKI